MEPNGRGTLTCALRGLRVAQGDLVGLGYVVGLDGSQPLAQALASLPQQLEGIAGGTLRGAALRVGPVFLDEVGLQGGGDFVGRLQRVVDGPVPCCVVNHAASIAPLVTRVLAAGYLAALRAKLNLIVPDGRWLYGPRRAFLVAVPGGWLGLRVGEQAVDG
jgi:hypothetical protein